MTDLERRRAMLIAATIRPITFTMLRQQNPSSDEDEPSEEINGGNNV